MAKFIIITQQGELIQLNQWQAVYGLEVGSNKIGFHFSIGETSIKEGGKVSELVIRVLDRYRDLKGSSVTINSLDRTQEHQDELTAQGYKTAKYSPHVVSMAADIDTISWTHTQEQVKLLTLAAKDCGVNIRIGYREYWNAKKQTFIHMDVCPEYYAVGKPFHGLQHPAAWEFAQSW